jgi:hypothetical protein
MSFALVTLGGPATVVDGTVSVQGFALEWPLNWALPEPGELCLVRAVIRAHMLLVVRVFAGADYQPLHDDDLIVIDFSE